MNNFLPNSHWLLNSKWAAPNSVTSAMSATGASLQAQVSVTGFTPSSNYPTIYTPNTRELYNGCMVTFGLGHGGLSASALRVSNLVPNVSFQVKIPFGQLTISTSMAETAFAIGTCSEWAGNQNMGPDGGWTKTASLMMWTDDFPANKCPGARRVLGLRKTVNADEDFYWQCPEEKLEKFLGRQFVFAQRTWMKTAGSTATARLFINDGINPPSFSPSLTGPTFSDPVYGGYQLEQVAQVISPLCTSLQIGIETDGVIGDIFYVANPTAIPGSSIADWQIGNDDQEIIYADTHFNAPSLVPWTGTMPTTALISGSGLYGYTELDIEGLTFGQVHGSVRAVTTKLELTTPTVDQTMFLSPLNVPEIALTFGPQCNTEAANIMDASISSMPLKPGTTAPAPGCFAMFTNVSGGSISSATVDFTDVIS